MAIFKYKYDELFNPVLKALHELGGSGTNAEIEEKVIEILKLNNSEVEDIHRGNTTKLSYRCAWAKNYLKRFGILENSSRAVWALTSKGKETLEINKEDVKNFVKNPREDSAITINDNVEVHSDDEELADLTWKEELVEILKTMEPTAFERLSQRVLRELGFSSVEVTGKSGDGGIDGVGVIKINSVLSFHIIFQCKKYTGSVSSGAIRDFRGAMIGRADKGLFITTGTFTRDATIEAKRDGAPPVDLIDGNELAEKLKELGLGVSTKMVEKINVETEWFKDI